MQWAWDLRVHGAHQSDPFADFYEYRGFVIGAWARLELTKDSTSIGVVYKRDKFGSMIQVQKIEGKSFESKEQAEQHGLQLCKEWIDNQFRVLEATTKK
jgi:hypothetical protein